MGLRLFPYISVTQHSVALAVQTTLPDHTTTSANSSLAAMNSLAIPISTSRGIETTVLNTTTSALNEANNMDLPVEIWLHIFDYVRSNGYARPDSTVSYANSLATYGDSIEAAKTLPAFEKQVWSWSRTLYAVNRNSRAAALRLRLCLRVLQTCSKPVVTSECLESLYNYSNPLSGPVPTLSYVAIQLDAEESPWNRNGEAWAAVHLIHQGAAAKLYLSLNTAKHVVLLGKCSGSPHMMRWTERLKCAIREFWKRNGVSCGDIESWK